MPGDTRKTSQKPLQTYIARATTAPDETTRQKWARPTAKPYVYTDWAFI